MEERTGSFDEDPERGPNSAVNEMFIDGAFQEQQEVSEEEPLGRHIDPDQVDEWEEEFEREVDQEVFEQGRAVTGSEYELVEEVVEDDYIHTVYTLDLEQVDMLDGDMPLAAAADTESIETILNAAYDDVHVEANTGEQGLELSVEYQDPESKVHGVSRVLGVYESFDEILTEYSREEP